MTSLGSLCLWRCVLVRPVFLEAALSLADVYPVGGPSYLSAKPKAYPIRELCKDSCVRVGTSEQRSIDEHVPECSPEDLNNIIARLTSEGMCIIPRWRSH